MSEYILISPKFAGNVVFGYSNGGILTLYHNESKMTEIQHDWLLKNLPAREEGIQALAAKIQGRLEEVPEDLSFDKFWEKYGKKINRKRCEPLWKRFSDAERLLVIKSIEPYRAYLKRTGYRGQADPEKYLKDGYYETNWNAEK